MKTLSALLAFIIIAPLCVAEEKVFPYNAFGPQVIAHPLIGMEWWQWQSHGDSRPREYPIQVVVYWNQSKEETQRQFPVDAKNEKDYRYVDLDSAIQHLAKCVVELKSSKLDSSQINQTLSTLRKIESGKAKAKVSPKKQE